MKKVVFVTCMIILIGIGITTKLTTISLALICLGWIALFVASGIAINSSYLGKRKKNEKEQKFDLIYKNYLRG